MILVYKNDFSLTGCIVYIPAGSSWKVKKKGEMSPDLGESPIDWKRQEQDTLLKQCRTCSPSTAATAKIFPREGSEWVGIALGRFEKPMSLQQR